MISTAQVIDELIKQTPSLETALASDIVNYSSLARMLKPQVEEKLFKDIKTGAIIMALKRTAKRLKKDLPANIQLKKHLGTITLRSNLVDYTFLNSPTIQHAQDLLLKKFETRKDLFLTVSHGVSQVTVVASDVCEKDIKELFKNESCITSITNLSSLTIGLSLEATKMVGIYYSILKILVWEKVSLVELISTFSELTIILQTKDIEKAFSILKNVA